MKGQPRKNLPVAQTCLERGWTVGTMLSSSLWKTTRTIYEIGNTFAMVGRNRIRSFPPDVKQHVETEEPDAPDHHP